MKANEYNDKKMNIFIDFDDVLFNTKQFIEDLRSVFGKHGISVEHFKESYKEIKILENVTAGYNYEKHIEYLRKEKEFDEKELKKEIDNFLEDLRKYVFSDSQYFLQSLHDKEHKMYLISYGLSDFQQKKVDGAHLNEYFTQSIVGEVEKGEAIQSIMEKDSNSDISWFIDDRIKFLHEVKKCCKEVKTILVCRSEGRYCDVPDKSCDFEVKNLIKAKDIILNFRSKILNT